ncbi:hypothetical protein FDP41_002902 [Naegleria fowleri]|uniref:Endonuclease/exonuclease/phosphatase domain-containing protein n=1 Tax=Naegleria fowleri TaxID=5763 RepID=A0A6A5BMX1_NAEFO|nr:uncharacterized protein FDP41_002902 [Naegleria fowleri]KAF0978387.1 hypothetical protein FDP41_002902 [Naegleria fowleri]
MKIIVKIFFIHAISRIRITIHTRSTLPVKTKEASHPGNNSLYGNHIQNVPSMYPTSVTYTTGGSTSPVYYSNFPTQPTSNYYAQNQVGGQNHHEYTGSISRSTMMNNSNMVSPTTTTTMSTNHGVQLPTLVVMSFNVLADCYVSDERYEHISNKNFLKWQNRKSKIFHTLKDRPYDIIGIQEIDQNHKKEFSDFASNHGYTILIRDKLPRKKDSIAIMFKTSRFGQPIGQGSEQIIEGYPEVFQYVLLKDPLSNSLVIVMNCHLTFQRDAITPRENQVKRMVGVLKDLHSKHKQYSTNRISVLLLGDFNTQPHESPVKFMENSMLQRAHQDRPDFWTFSTSHQGV